MVIRIQPSRSLFLDFKKLGKFKKVTKIVRDIPNVRYKFRNATFEARAQIGSVVGASLESGCLRIACDRCIFSSVKRIEQEIARQRWRKRSELVMGLAALDLPVLVLLEIWKLFRRTSITDNDFVSWKEIAYVKSKRCT